MATINVSLPADGSTADAADYNTPITTIVDEFNGNIDNANIKSGAAIDGAKLASSSVTPTQWTNPYCFGAYLSANQTGLTTGTFNTIAFNSEFFDPNSNFDTTTYAYTVPVTGIYRFTINAQTVTSSTDQALTVYVNATDSYHVGRYPNSTASASRTLDGTIMLSLTAGDTVQARMYAVASSWVIGGDTDGKLYASRFFGELIYRTA